MNAVFASFCCISHGVRRKLGIWSYELVCPAARATVSFGMLTHAAARAATDVCTFRLKLHAAKRKAASAAPVESR